MHELRQLIGDALTLMNPAFVDASKPASVLCEFYHQFRKLWDRGIPVGMGLGHLLIKPIDANSLGIHRLGEHGKGDEALAAVCYGTVTHVTDFECTIVVTFVNIPPLPGVTILKVNRGTVTIIE